MSALLPGPLPKESGIDCADCAMSRAPGQLEDGDGLHFDAELKCCTYYPDLANFVVGDILAGGASPGREVVLARIEHGRRVSPLGITCPPLHDTVTREHTSDQFGHSSRLRCAFLSDRATCAIWPQREATCATYFCRFDHDAEGGAFWAELHKLLFVVEQQLAFQLMLTIDVGRQATAGLQEPACDDDPDDFASPLDQAERDLLWGRWSGREVDYFVATSKLVETLSWEQILNCCGPTARAHADAVVAAHRALPEPNPGGVT